MDSSRVVNALQRDPDLLFAVAAKLAGARILGPWQYVGDRKMVRKLPNGKVKATVERPTLAEHGWLVRKPDGGLVRRVALSDIAMQLADDIWRRAGWVPIESKCQHRFVFATGNTSQGLSFRDLDGTEVGSITPCNSNRFDSTAQWKLFPTSKW